MQSASEKLLTRRDIADMYGLSIETIKKYRAWNQCGFPREDFKLGRTPVWKLSTVLKWRPVR